MTKKLANTADLFNVSKDKEGYHFTVTDTFRKSAVKAALDVDSLLTDVTPIAVNLWTAYKKVVVTDAAISRLTFFNAFDSTIPVQYGKPGSKERKELDSHKVYNRMSYLVFKVGKIAAGDGPKKRDPKVAKQQAKKDVESFGAWARRFKIPVNALQTLVKDIMGLKSKSGELTKKGTSYLQAAGMSVE